MSRTSARRIGSMLLTALIVALMVSSARAAVVKEPTVLTVERLAPVVWGQRAQVIAHLRLLNGVSLGDHHVDLHLAGDVAGGRTDATGKAVFDTKTPVNPGTYFFQVTFNGSSTLLPSQAGGTLTVEPRFFTIRTVPANPGLPFNFSGTEFLSDAQGVARIQVSPTFDASLRPATGDKQVAPGIMERFARWRTHNGDIYATYEMYYQISLAFVDLSGHPVDPARVTKVDLKSAIGDVLSVPARSPFTVLGQRVVPLAGELTAKDVTYAAEDVVVDGASVIHVAQQRFTPSKDRVWTITLLFYSAHITVSDALFGFPIDSNVAVTYPDGHVVGVRTKNGQLSLTALARGDYRVLAQGWGISFSRPVSLSRDQEVDLKFISYLDVGVATGLLLVIVLGLVVAGRPGKAQALREMLRSRRARVATAAAVGAAPRAGAVASGPRPVRDKASGHFPRGSGPIRFTPTPSSLRVPTWYVVRAGDSVRSIAATLLGDENRWPEILHANGDLLLDPERILPGTRLRIP